MCDSQFATNRMSGADVKVIRFQQAQSRHSQRCSRTELPECVNLFEANLDFEGEWKLFETKWEDLCRRARADGSHFHFFGARRVFSLWWSTNARSWSVSSRSSPPIWSAVVAIWTASIS